MPDLTPERRAKLRQLTDYVRQAPRGGYVPVHPDHVLALLDAADERDRLRERVSYMMQPPSADDRCVVTFVSTEP